MIQDLAPQRIVCLSTETVEVLYLLGAQDRIAGISGFTVRPARARKEKPKVSGFSSAKIERILAVQPDLVLAFSDLQADMVREVIKAGIEVHVFNQRSLAGILAMIRSVGALVGAQDRAAALVAELQAIMAGVSAAAAHLPRRPTVYFEEWDQPMISGIQWVSELITLAGGQDAFPELASQPSAAGRIIADPQAVLHRAPDIIIGSWCGKKFQPDSLATRPGWSALPALIQGEVHEIKSPLILSPGPAAISAGLPQLAAIIQNWGQKQQ